MSVILNSLIGRDPLVNYSYPDPSLFDQSLVMVAYDNDVDQVGQLMIDTIQSVEGVDSDREIGAWLLKFKENQVVFTIGWWIPSYADKYYVRNRFNRAIVRALNEAGVVLPYQKGRFEVESDSESRGFSGSKKEDPK